MNRNVLMFSILLLLFIVPNSVLAQENEPILAVYITGVGCPNCAITDPVVLSEYTSNYPHLIIVEYEIYNFRTSNQAIAGQYFETYLSGSVVGVPLIIFNKEQVKVGRFQVIDSKEVIEGLTSNNLPLPDGSSVSFNELDLTTLPGKVNIWGKDRVLTSGASGNNEILKEFLTTDDVSSFVKEKGLVGTQPVPVEISGARVNFEHAALVGGWLVQWSDEEQGVTNGITPVDPGSWRNSYTFIILIGLLLLFILMYKFKMVDKNFRLDLTENQKNYLIIGTAVSLIIVFFILAKNVSPDSLERIGYSLPLPLFTLLIALVDGFNPCNLFVLTFLLGLLLSVSSSKKRILLVGYTFILVIFLFYFFFMVAWLNVFKYIGFVTPLRIGIGILAIVAGLINCKELIAFKKGITLMIQNKHVQPLKDKMEKMKNVIKNGSTSALIAASASLAVFASLLELPCTAGFPIIYTGILTGKVLASSFSYYSYLILYNIIYVVPLLVIITIFGHTLKGDRITKRQMQIIKFIGGIIMILLGLILLVNPQLIGLGI